MNKRSWAFVAAVLLAISTVKATEIVTTDNPESKAEVNLFNCRQKVYVVVRWQPLLSSDHTLTVVWKNPHGVVEQTTRVPITGPATWAWLALDGSGGLLGALSAENGFDTYVGRWKADVSVDGSLIGTVEFTVSC